MRNSYPHFNKNTARMIMLVFVLFILLPTHIHSKTETDISLMYYDYNGSSFYKSGTYGSASIKKDLGDNTFSFFIGNQRTKGKTDLQSFSDYNFHEIWTDSVYYSTPDTIFVNAFLDTAAVIIVIHQADIGFGFAVDVCWEENE